jgi:hypothetical protein
VLPNAHRWTDKRTKRHVSIFPRIEVDVCPLCGSAGPLRDSHIIPRFVFDWMLESSATGHIRFGTAPNLRVQDGMKQRLLCGACEERLSVWEKETAESLFLPYHRGTLTRVQYGSWLAKFCASIAWRVLFVHSRVAALTNLSASQTTRAENALELWKDVMFDRAPNPGTFELHLLPLEILAGTAGLSLPPNMNRYLARAVEMDVVSTSQSAFVYTKLCMLIVLGFIQLPQVRQWQGSRVAMNRGVIEPRQLVAPIGFAEYLAERAQRMGELQAQLSDRQRKKINATMRSDLDRTARSDTFNAMSQDVAMFGKLAFQPREDE